MSDFELVQFADDTSIVCRYVPGENKLKTNLKVF